MDLASFIPSVGSILYLAFTILFIKELIQMIASLFKSDGSKSSVADKAIDTWGNLRDRWKAHQANQQQKAKAEEEKLQKDKEAAQQLGRYKAQLELKSQQAGNLILEGSNKLQELIQNPQYEGFAKDIKEKIVDKMAGAATSLEKMKQGLFNAASNDFTLMKQFDTSIKANKKQAQQMIDDNNKQISAIQKSENDASKNLPKVVKDIPNVENKIKDLQTKIDAEKKKPKPNNKSLANWARALENNTKKLDDLKKAKVSLEKIINESQANIKVYQQANDVLAQKVTALEDLLKNFEKVDIPQDNEFKTIEHNSITLIGNLKRAVLDLQKHFDELVKIKVDDIKNSQNVGTYKHRIEQAVVHVAEIIQRVTESQQDELKIHQTITQHKDQFLSKLTQINDQTNQALVSINFWNSTPSGVPAPSNGPTSTNK